MIARRIRDIVRGLTGAYLIEGRLGELGEAIRSLSPPANLDTRLGDLDAGLGDLNARFGDLNARFGDLDSRLTLVEARLRRLDNLTAHAVVRDVGIAEYMGFPSYFYRDDMAFRANIAAGPSPTVDMTLEAAQNSVTRRINNRKRMTPQYLIGTYWTIFNKHDYNEIHKPLIAVLHETGRASDFVDVGANVGDTAMSAAEAIEMLGLDTHVHSFEPGPIFDLARANFALNRLDERISVHNVAASDAGGYLPMQIMVGHAESGSIGGISAHYDIPVGETRFVRAARLDAFLPNDGRSYFIKIDAEGADFAVVRGAAGLIASGRAPI
jgi:FkbM family methyltransferase